MWCVLPVYRGGMGADLSEECDWLLSHSMCITNVGFDNLSKWLLHSLQSKNTKTEVIECKCFSFFIKKLKGK